MQCACAVLLSVACLAVLHFSTLSHEWHDLKKKLLDINCVFWFSLRLLCETLILILRRTERYVIKMYIGLRVKYLLFMSDFNESWTLSADFRKIPKYKMSWKSYLWEPTFSVRTDKWRSKQSLFAIIWTRLKQYKYTKTK